MKQTQLGVELMPVTDGNPPMSNEARGHAIKRRRLAAGINSLREFAEATGLSRQTIARAEEGDHRTTDSTYARLEVWLDRFDTETTSEAEHATKAAAGVPGVDVDAHTGSVTFRLAGNFGVDVTVEGPVSNMAELQASVAALLKQMQSNGD